MSRMPGARIWDAVSGSSKVFTSARRDATNLPGRLRSPGKIADHRKNPWIDRIFSKNRLTFFPEKRILLYYKKLQYMGT